MLRKSCAGFLPETLKSKGSYGISSLYSMQLLMPMSIQCIVLFMCMLCAWLDHIITILFAEIAKKIDLNYKGVNLCEKYKKKGVDYNTL